MPICGSKLFSFLQMSNYYRAPTANAPIGAVDKEIRRMEKQAKRLQSIRRSRPLTACEIAAARRQFTGIHRRFLKLAPED